MNTALHIAPALLVAALAASPGLAAGTPWPAGAALTEAAGTPGAEPAQPAMLEPFVATYEAWNGGRPAGTATMRLDSLGGQWRVDLDVTGNRGLARWLRLDIDQGTLFDVVGGHYRPLRQDTRRKAVFMDRAVEGVYDWASGTAQWSGDIKAKRRAAVQLREGDMSALLINLAIVRDAAPGRDLAYRYVDGGRVRDHRYTVSATTETIEVDGLSYEAMRVSRTNGGNDETIVWVAQGVPTPIRILQREDGEDGIDLRLVAYEGVN